MNDSIQNALIGLLDKGEWKTLAITVSLSFAITYIIKIFYFLIVDKEDVLKAHIRLIAITSGLIASALFWPVNAISMNWYTAGILIGPLSIFVYHLLVGVVSMPVINNKAPFLKKIIKGIGK